ncbi:DUF2937 domain-containing protein [Loktanella sp. D2R18]|uniref:DUF2937 family protein n=1 Tax=Rhodobacterales TaxID=204455 RepID=UPI000DE8F512|nr:MULTISPECIES: DUF2937 family protein [Rhodobacterales]MDO6589179.1 DUF2937 family protein [Yoonia sp. 1_MG-2023]RBW45393.1 DUF2937 domain-containing protein [Loktanella sp. D2R18]
MIRVLCLVGGVAGAAGLSQYPEFSQQYMQRLGGQVDELARQVKEFDATALEDGLGREEMLEAMAEVPLTQRQEAMWRRTIARHVRLGDNLAALRDASAMQRMLMPHRMADVQTFQAAWQDFTPAVPISTAGAAAAGSGFIGGWALIGTILSLLTLPFRRNQRTVAPKQTLARIKADPPVARPTPRSEVQSHIRPLSGAKR